MIVANGLSLCGVVIMIGPLSFEDKDVGLVGRPYLNYFDLKFQKLV
jgi:hypothetical protein